MGGYRAVRIGSPSAAAKEVCGSQHETSLRRRPRLPKHGGPAAGQFPGGLSLGRFRRLQIRMRGAPRVTERLAP